MRIEASRLRRSELVNHEQRMVHWRSWEWCLRHLFVGELGFGLFSMAESVVTPSPDVNLNTELGITAVAVSSTYAGYMIVRSLAGQHSRRLEESYTTQIAHIEQLPFSRELGNLSELMLRQYDDPEC